MPLRRAAFVAAAAILAFSARPCAANPNVTAAPAAAPKIVVVAMSPRAAFGNAATQNPAWLGTPTVPGGAVGAFFQALDPAAKFNQDLLLLGTPGSAALKHQNALLYAPFVKVLADSVKDEAALNAMSPQDRLELFNEAISTAKKQVAAMAATALKQASDVENGVAGAPNATDAHSALRTVQYFGLFLDKKTVDGLTTASKSMGEKSLALKQAKVGELAAAPLGGAAAAANPADPNAPAAPATPAPPAEPAPAQAELAVKEIEAGALALTGLAGKKSAADRKAAEAVVASLSEIGRSEPLEFVQKAAVKALSEELARGARGAGYLSKVGSALESIGSESAHAAVSVDAVRAVLAGGLAAADAAKAAIKIGQATGGKDILSFIRELLKARMAVAEAEKKTAVKDAYQAAIHQLTGMISALPEMQGPPAPAAAAPAAAASAPAAASVGRIRGAWNWLVRTGFIAWVGLALLGGILYVGYQMRTPNAIVDPPAATQPAQEQVLPAFPRNGPLTEDWKPSEEFRNSAQQSKDMLDKD